MSGYPPKAVNLNNGSASLASLNIVDGDKLIVSNKNGNIHTQQATPAAAVVVAAVPEPEPQMKRKEVPADNSCLFYSVDFAVHEGQLDLERAKLMRARCAHVILADPDQYNEAVLEKSPDDYCAWIQSDTSWGGSVEIQILAKMHRIEIVVVDIQ